MFETCGILIVSEQNRTIATATATTASATTATSTATTATTTQLQLLLQLCVSHLRHRSLEPSK